LLAIVVLILTAQNEKLVLLTESVNMQADSTCIDTMLFSFC